jgi:hypothetical protein
MSEDRKLGAVQDVTMPYRGQLGRGDQSDTTWIEKAIEVGLASPPSKRSLAEIMAEQRAAIG